MVANIPMRCGCSHLCGGCLGGVSGRATRYWMIWFTIGIRRIWHPLFRWSLMFRWWSHRGYSGGRVGRCWYGGCRWHDVGMKGFSFVNSVCVCSENRSVTWWLSSSHYEYCNDNNTHHVISSNSSGCFDACCVWDVFLPRRTAITLSIPYTFAQDSPTSSALSDNHYELFEILVLVYYKYKYIYTVDEVTNYMKNRNGLQATMKWGPRFQHHESLGIVLTVSNCRWYPNWV